MNITIHFIPSQSFRIGVGLLFSSLLLSGLFFAHVVHAESSPNSDQVDAPAEAPSQLYQEVVQTPEMLPSPTPTTEFPTDADPPDEVTPDSVTSPDFNAVAKETVENTQPDARSLTDPGTLFASPQPDLSSTQ